MVLKTSRCRYCAHVSPRGWCQVTGAYKSGRELDEPGECWWYAERGALVSDEDARLIQGFAEEAAEEADG